MAAPRGYLALILHAHLPYVRPTGEEILEERWLYEAVAETYLPLLWALEGLQGQVPVRLAISLSPPLLAMLADPELMARCRRHLTRVAELAEREAARHRNGALAAAARFHRERFHRAVQDLERRRDGLLPAFAALEQAGMVELFTSAATHGFLPLLATDAGRAAQVRAGQDEFARLIGHRPAGFWLPECAYAPGLDHLLAAGGVRWFVADAGTATAAFPPVAGLPCRPVQTPGGPAAFPRDPEAARQVWSGQVGYPGDPCYREFYRDVGYDLPLEQIGPWLVEGRVRGDTGLKYYRITGAGTEKEPYDPERAAARAAGHARHFVEGLTERAGRLAGPWGPAGAPLFTAPFDAELFGHWWFEGPIWLEQLFRELTGSPITPLTPSDYLARWPDPPVARLPGGTWGEAGDHRVWLSPANDWLWPELHAAELRLCEQARAAATPAPPALQQAARELLLAQSSDWPFIIYGGTAVAYAERRARTHLERCQALLDHEAAPDQLTAWAAEARLLPHLEAGLFAPAPALPAPAAGAPLRVLMLSWEFPPANVGGLGRHVHDLGGALAARGHAVHVITLADQGRPEQTEQLGGMTVDRVARPAESGEFLTWVYRFNQAMVRAAERAAAASGPFHLVHCHDWLVGQAGMALRARWQVPLVATVHATERGRNGGIVDPLQQAIHEEELCLTRAAGQVVTVSQAMAAEVAAGFQVAADRLQVIYNGVAPAAPADPELMAQLRRRVDGAPYLFFIGRLVPEKGVQAAIAALARTAQPVRLVVAGRGPYEPQLRQAARQYGVAHRVIFTGRVTDAERDGWLQGAVAGLVPSLYEPFGIVALEIMAAGVPAIVTAAGGLAEIVADGEDGLQVPPGDAGALAAAVDRLLAGPAEARRLAAAGLAKARDRFGWPAIAAETERVYRQAWAAGENLPRNSEPSPWPKRHLQ